jgi:hypothetical protein
LKQNLYIGVFFIKINLRFRLLLLSQFLFIINIYSQNSLQDIRKSNLIIYDFIDDFERCMNFLPKDDNIKDDCKDNLTTYFPENTLLLDDLSDEGEQATMQPKYISFPEYIKKLRNESLNISEVKVYVKSIFQVDDTFKVCIQKVFNGKVKCYGNYQCEMLDVLIFDDELKVLGSNYGNYYKSSFYLIFSVFFKDNENAVKYMESPPYVYLNPIGVIKNIEDNKYYICISAYDTAENAQRKIDALIEQEWLFKFSYVKISEYEMVYTN